jgi:hypothetical protein
MAPHSRSAHPPVDPQLRIKRELLGRPASRHGLTLLGVARGDLLGHRDVMGLIAARSEVAHGQCEKHDRQPGAWDQDGQQREVRLSDQGHKSLRSAVAPGQAARPRRRAYASRKGSTSNRPASSKRRWTWLGPGIRTNSYPWRSDSSFAKRTARSPVESMSVSLLKSSAIALVAYQRCLRRVALRIAVDTRSNSPVRASVRRPPQMRSSTASPRGPSSASPLRLSGSSKVGQPSDHALRSGLAPGREPSQPDRQCASGAGQAARAVLDSVLGPRHGYGQSAAWATSAGHHRPPHPLVRGAR